MRLTAALILTTILAMAGITAPQSRQKTQPEVKRDCGAVITPEQFNAELARKKTVVAQSSALPPPTATPYYLPLSMHLVHRSDGSGGMSLNAMEILVARTNELWRPAGIQFFIYGIDHIYDDTHFDLPASDESLNALRQVNVVAGTINVYFTNLPGSFCGLASFPWGSVQGVLIDIACGGDGYPIGIDRTVLAHEIGHYLNLYHTHETIFDVQCPSENDCDEDGDLICDTRADPNLYPPEGSSRVDYDCNYDGSAPIPSGCDQSFPYIPPVNNVMSYSRPHCISEFTPGQISRALDALRTHPKRRNLPNAKVRYVVPGEGWDDGCTHDKPCGSVEEAVQSANDGDYILLKPGVHKASVVVGKQVIMKRWGDTGVVEIVP